MIIHTTTKKFNVNFAAVAFTGDLWIGGFANVAEAVRIFSDPMETATLLSITDEINQTEKIFEGYTQLKYVSIDASTGLYNIGLGKP